MKEINLTYVTIRYKSPIVYLSFKKGAHLGFPEILELIKCAEKLSEHTPYLILSDVRENIMITPEGKRFSADEKHAPFHKGTAVVVKNTIFKLAANFFSDMKTPKFPFRAFTNEEEAVNWLLQLPIEN